MSSYHLCFPTVFVAGYVWIFQIMMSEFCVHDSSHYVRVSKVKVIKNMLCFLTQVPSTPSFSDNILKPKDFGLLRWCIPLLSWIHDLKLHSEPFFCYEVAVTKDPGSISKSFGYPLEDGPCWPWKGTKEMVASSFAIHWNAQIWEI